MAKKVASITKRNQKKFVKKPLRAKSARMLKVKPTETMTEDRILAIIDRCWEMHSLCYFDREIAIEIKESFELETVPTRSMIRYWLEKGKVYTTANLIKNQNDFQNKVMGVIDTMLRKWVPVAAAENLPITRTKVVNGMKESYLDEDGFEEQIKAGNLVTKLLKEGRDTLGIGHNNAMVDLEGIDKASMLTLIQTVNQYILQPGQKPKDIDAMTGEVLELESGLPDHQL